jgi:hypothetical protein
MLLSLTEVKLNLASRMNGFVTGQVAKQHPLDGPLVVAIRSQGDTRSHMLPTTLRDMLVELMATNPHVQKFATLLEQPHKGYAIVDASAISKLVGDHAARDPTGANRAERTCIRGILAGLVASRPTLALNASKHGYQVAGHLTKREDAGTSSRHPMMVNYEGLSLQ